MRILISCETAGIAHMPTGHDCARLLSKSFPRMMQAAAQQWGESAAVEVTA